MEEVPHDPARPPKGSRPSAGACVIFAGVGLLLLLTPLYFSLGPLIYTRGHAWEYDLVRDLFIISVVLFVLFVLAPLVAAYRLSRGRR